MPVRLKRGSTDTYNTIYNYICIQISGVRSSHLGYLTSDARELYRILSLDSKFRYLLNGQTCHKVSAFWLNFILTIMNYECQKSLLSTYSPCRVSNFLEIIGKSNNEHVVYIFSTQLGIRFNKIHNQFTLPTSNLNCGNNWYQSGQLQINSRNCVTMLSSLIFICIWYLIFIIYSLCEFNAQQQKKENDPITQQL
ncbi:hypothetical protein AGLY_012653 [Aphis glycines]|uniref:Uncharacterized protein n=1 Tax=Aphis glycines TaxID=307491 RepID=A0A6G0T8X7_APHGL|nr:hypothetical protein AGLY_012653 [Aphis glycines]